jgi:outer membrane biosynthesis protein TonB
MGEFLSKYWYFLVAGVLFLAVTIYWIVQVSISNKRSKEARQQKLAMMQKQNKEEQNVETGTSQEVEQAEMEEKAEEKTEEKIEVKEEKQKKSSKTKAEKTVVSEKAEEVKKEKQTKKSAKEESKQKAEKEEVVEETVEHNQEKPSYIVVYDSKKLDWVVKREGNERATKRCRTKQEAMEVIESLASNNVLKVTVSKKDGEIQSVTQNKKVNNENE